MIQYNKLVLAKDAIKINTTLPRIANNAEECQYPEAFDPLVVQGSVVICTFSTGFYNGTSTLTAIIQTANLLRFRAFVFVANPTYGDFIAEPIPFATPAIIIPATNDTQVCAKTSIFSQLRKAFFRLFSQKQTPTLPKYFFDNKCTSQNKLISTPYFNDQTGFDIKLHF